GTLHSGKKHKVLLISEGTSQSYFLIHATTSGSPFSARSQCSRWLIVWCRCDAFSGFQYSSLSPANPDRGSCIHSIAAPIGVLSRTVASFRGFRGHCRKSWSHDDQCLRRRGYEEVHHRDYRYRDRNF